MAALAFGEPPEELPEPATLAPAIVAQRLAPIVVERLAGTGRHPALVAALRPAAAAAARADLAQTAALLEVARTAGSTELLVIKGAALGPLLYGSGAMRPRADVDVWLRSWMHVEALAKRLEPRGWDPVHQLPGRVARHAIAMCSPHGVAIDLHATSSRRVRAARALPFDVAWSARTTLTLEGHELATVNTAHAFLLSALHLTAHHAGQVPPLVLLEDLRRLAMRLDLTAWYELLDTVVEAGLATAAQQAIHELRCWSAQAVPDEVTRALDALEPDPSALFGHPLLAALDDLSLLDAEEAVAYIDELVRPPAAYLYAHYGVAGNRSPALLRAARLARGVVAHLGAHRHNRAS